MKMLKNKGVQWVAAADQSKGWFVRRMMQTIDTTVLRRDSSWILWSKRSLYGGQRRVRQEGDEVLVLPARSMKNLLGDGDYPGTARSMLQLLYQVCIKINDEFAIRRSQMTWSVLFLWRSRRRTNLREQQRRMNIQETDPYEYLSLLRARSATTAKDNLWADKELKTQETQQTLWQNRTTTYQYWPMLILRDMRPAS